MSEQKAKEQPNRLAELLADTTNPRLRHAAGSSCPLPSGSRTFNWLFLCIAAVWMAYVVLGALGAFEPAPERNRKFAACPQVWTADCIANARGEANANH